MIGSFRAVPMVAGCVVLAMFGGDACSHPLPLERRELLTVATEPWPIVVATEITGHHHGAIGSCASGGSASGFDTRTLWVTLEARRPGSNETRLHGETGTWLASDDGGSRAIVRSREQAIAIDHCLAPDGRTWAARANAGVEGAWHVVHLFDEVGAVVRAQNVSPLDSCAVVLERAPAPRVWLEQRLDAGDAFGLACRVIRDEPSLVELASRCEPSSQ